MSQHLVSKTHIDALMTAALRWCSEALLRFDVINAAGDVMSRGHYEVNRDNADEIGRLLWEHNYWYSGWGDYDQLHDEETADPDVLAVRSYRFSELPGEPDPILILGALDYYGYQTRPETPDEWVNSIGFAFTDLLRSGAIRQIPGYDRVPWGLDEPDIFLTWAARRP